MQLYNLGSVNWIQSQSLYHALACLGREGLILCSPAQPYVCLGLHDDLDHEIDQDFCQAHGIPLLRRETGGGVVYLDNQQIFYQLVMRRDNRLLPLRRSSFYGSFLQPALTVLKSLGIAAEIKAPADIVIRGLKCSGNACGDIGQCVAYVGNLLLGFDHATMCNVLRLPSEDFRLTLYAIMRRHVTTLAEWSSQPLDYSSLSTALLAGFKEQLGDLKPGIVDDELRQTARVLGERLTSSQWLQLPGRRPPQRRVKIAEGVYLCQADDPQAQNSMIIQQHGGEELLSSGHTTQSAVL